MWFILIPNMSSALQHAFSDLHLTCEFNLALLAGSSDVFNHDLLEITCPIEFRGHRPRVKVIKILCFRLSLRWAVLVAPFLSICPFKPHSGVLDFLHHRRSEVKVMGSYRYKCLCTQFYMQRGHNVFHNTCPCYLWFWLSDRNNNHISRVESMLCLL